MEVGAERMLVFWTVKRKSEKDGWGGGGDEQEEEKNKERTVFQ